MVDKSIKDLSLSTGFSFSSNSLSPSIAWPFKPSHGDEIPIPVCTNFWYAFNASDFFMPNCERIHSTVKNSDFSSKPSEKHGHTRSEDRTAKSVAKPLC